MNTSQALERLIAINPVAEAGAAKRLHLEQWDAMFNEIVGARPSARPHRFGQLSIALSVAACALTLAVVLPALMADAPGGASPAAADALHRAADAARAQKALPAPAPGEYLYRRTVQQATHMHVPGHDLANFLFTETTEVEDWGGQDNSGRTLSQSSQISFPTAGDEAAWRAAGQPRLKDRQRDEREAAGSRYVLNVNDVPTNPEELLGAIERREILGGDSADWVTFQIIGELLQLTYHSPEHRAALYEVAANFPGVEYEGKVRVSQGRMGDAVSYEGGGTRRELIFDPNTAELLAERIVLLEQEEDLVDEDPWPGTEIAYAGPPGTVAWWNVYEKTAVVESRDSRP